MESSSKVLTERQPSLTHYPDYTSVLLAVMSPLLQAEPYLWIKGKRCTYIGRFIGHMVNQHDAHEVLALEILTLLLENPTDDSAEVAITLLKEVGQKLSEKAPRGIHAIFERLRHVLHKSTLDKRTKYMIEFMFQVS